MASRASARFRVPLGSIDANTRGQPSGIQFGTQSGGIPDKENNNIQTLLGGPNKASSPEDELAEEVAVAIPAESHQDDSAADKPVPEGAASVIFTPSLTPASSRLVAATAPKPKARNGHAKNPFIANWYNIHKVYADNTLYSKVGIPQMEAFLAGEGVDVEKRFPRKGGNFYRCVQNKREKIERGLALVDFVKKVQQRILDQKNRGLPVGPNMAPHLGAEEYDDNETDIEEEAEDATGASGSPGSSNGAAAGEALGPDHDRGDDYDNVDFGDDTDVEVEADGTLQSFSKGFLDPQEFAGMNPFAATWHAATAGYQEPTPALATAGPRSYFTQAPFRDPAPEFVTLIQVPNAVSGSMATPHINDEQQATGATLTGAIAQVNDEHQAAGATHVAFAQNLNAQSVPQIVLHRPTEDLRTVAHPQTHRPGSAMGLAPTFAPRPEIADSPVTNQTRQTLAFMKAEFEKDARNAHSATAVANADDNFQQAQTELVLRNDRGDILISVAAQQEVRRIIAGYNRYFANRRRRYEPGTKASAYRKGHEASFLAYQQGRSDLMGHLMTDVHWDLPLSGWKGKKIEKIVADVFPVFAVPQECL